MGVAGVVSVGTWHLKQKKVGSDFSGEGAGRGPGRRAPASAGGPRGATAGRARGAGERTRGARAGGAGRRAPYAIVIGCLRVAAETPDLTPKCRKEKRLGTCVLRMLWGLFVLLCMLYLRCRAVVPF